MGRLSLLLLKLLPLLLLMTVAVMAPPLPLPLILLRTEVDRLRRRRLRSRRASSILTRGVTTSFDRATMMAQEASTTMTQFSIFVSMSCRSDSWNSW
jgi:predicted metal-binding membrane protein